MYFCACKQTAMPPYCDGRYGSSYSTHLALSLTNRADITSTQARPPACQRRRPGLSPKTRTLNPPYSRRSSPAGERHTVACLDTAAAATSRCRLSPPSLSATSRCRLSPPPLAATSRRHLSPPPTVTLAAVHSSCPRPVATATPTLPPRAGIALRPIPRPVPEPARWMARYHREPRPCCPVSRLRACGPAAAHPSRPPLIL